MSENPVRAEAERSLAMITALMDSDSATFIALRDEAINADPAQALYSMTWLLRLSLNAIAAMSDDKLHGRELLQFVAIAIAGTFEGL